MNNWYGQYPSHWKLERLQNYLVEINESNNPVKSDNILSLTNKLGVVPYSEKGNQGNVAKENLEGYKLAYPDTIVCNCMNVLIGSVGISKYYGCVSPVYYVYKAKDNTDLEFINYVFQTVPFQKELRRYANGILEIRLRVSSSNILKREIPIPSKEEQVRIVKAIKNKEEKINALISNEEKQIEKLKAYKQALISEVVTKGLDPNIPMKDSGVDWIGKIPFSWSVIRLKQLFNIYSGSTPRSNESLFYDGDIVWVTPADYKTDDVFVLDSKRKITAAGLKSCNLTIVENGSLIISKRAPIGTVAMAGTNLCTNQGCLSCTPKNMLINTKFYYYVLSVVGRELDILGSGTTFKEISYTNFGNFNIPYPSYRIQNLICAYLDSISNNITSINEKHINKISLLRKYRQSMIYEYVTGKRKVY